MSSPQRRSGSSVLLGALSEETFKRWLAVLIAVVTLCVGVATLLQNQASGRSGVLTRASQEAAIRATGEQTQGQQRVALDRYGILALTDELYAYAVRNQALDKNAVGQAYLEARQALEPLSPLLSSNYSQFDDKGFRVETDFGRYEADTYLVSARLYDEQRRAYAEASSGWSAKGDAYVAVIAILAISLFLFALASTLGGFVRLLFVGVGMVIGVVAVLWMVATALVPVHQRPEDALHKVAEGVGYAAQASNYYFVGRGIAGMPLPYDVSRVSEPTDIYKTNTEQYASHTNEFWQKAIDAYSKALELDPTYATAYSLRGLARGMVRPAQSGEAVDDLQAAIANGRDDYGTYWNLALAEYEQGQFEAAIRASQLAAQRNVGICGPEFTTSQATLAQDKAAEASQLYEAAITRCDAIYQDAVKRGERPPVSLWSSMEAAADGLDDLLCALVKENCYADRNPPLLKSIQDPTALAARTRALRKQVKEALTALEFMGTTKVTPTGATFAPLTFGYYMVNPNNANQFLNYAEKSVFPYNEFAPDVDSFSSYAGMSKDYLVIWKVRHNGVEDPGLRYADKWNLEEHGPVVRRLNSWYVMLPGLYELEIYVNGELVQSGSFEISPQEQLVNELPTGLEPAAPVPVGKLILAETFDNNNANWWTGSGVVQEEGTVAGTLDMVTHQKDHAFSSSCTPCNPPADMYVEADASYVSGPTDLGYGLIYRAEVNLNTFYTFLISANGYYLVAKYDNGWTRLIDWTPSSAVTKVGANKLGVWCRGARCEFFINGTRVNAVTDSSLSGRFVGLRVDQSEIEAAFDNVRVWSVQ